MALFILPSDSRNVAPTSTLDSLQAASVPPPQRDISIASSTKTNEFLINPSSGTPFPSIPLLPLLSGSSSSSSERPFQFAPSTPVFVLSTTPLLGTIATTRSSLRTTPTSTVPLNSNNPQNPISSASPSSFRTEARSMKEQATIAPVPIMSMLDNTDPFADPTSFSLLPSSGSILSQRLSLLCSVFLVGYDTVLE